MPFSDLYTCRAVLVAIAVLFVVHLLVDATFAGYFLKEYRNEIQKKGVESCERYRTPGR